MVYVRELDIMLRSLFYWRNYQWYQKALQVHEDVEAWIRFFTDNRSVFRTMTSSAKDYGLIAKVGHARGMHGEREAVLHIRHLYFPCAGLKLYPKLLYSAGYIPRPADFNRHRYYFAYYPPVLVPAYKREKDSTWSVVRLRQRTTTGTHWYIKANNEHRIAYNIASPITLYTIIEEELHAQGQSIHGTSTIKEIIAQIESQDPDLKNEVASSLNRVLSTETQRYQQYGDHLTSVHMPLLQLLTRFSTLFENQLITSKIH
jgi:hypothetical protein